MARVDRQEGATEEAGCSLYRLLPEESGAREVKFKSSRIDVHLRDCQKNNLLIYITIYGTIRAKNWQLF